MGCKIDWETLWKKKIFVHPKSVPPGAIFNVQGQIQGHLSGQKNLKKFHSTPLEYPYLGAKFEKNRLRTRGDRIFSLKITFFGAPAPRGWDKNSLLRSKIIFYQDKSNGIKILPKCHRRLIDPLTTPEPFSEKKSSIFRRFFFLFLVKLFLIF